MYVKLNCFTVLNAISVITFVGCSRNLQTKFRSRSRYNNVQFDHDWHEPNKLSAEVPTGIPEMEVFWPGKPGEIWAGLPLRAKCKTYAGSKNESQTPGVVPELAWRLQTLDPESSVEWTVNFTDPVYTPFKYKNFPDRKRCRNDMSSSKELGACYIYLFPLPYEWAEAHQYCARNYNFTLANINSQRQFDHVKGLTKISPGLEFFINVNDLAKEGHYVTMDGRSVDIPDTYWDPNAGNKSALNSDTNDCGVLSTDGFAMRNCSNESIPFICISNDNLVFSANNQIVDPKFGTFVTSFIEIMPNTSLNGASLQCASDPAAWTMPPGERREMLVSPVSEKFVFKRGQTIPTLARGEEILGGDLIMTVTCEALVGSDGAMSLTITDRWRQLIGTWVVIGDSEEIKTLHETADVNISMIENTMNDDIGHRIVSSARIRFSNTTNNAIVTCYPYNKTNPRPDIISYLNLHQLQNSHLLSLKNLSRLSLNDVSVVLQKRYGSDYNRTEWREPEADLPPPQSTESTKALSTTVAITERLESTVEIPSAQGTERTKAASKANNNRSSMLNKFMAGVITFSLLAILCLILGKTREEETVRTTTVYQENCTYYEERFQEQYIRGVQSEAEM